jgi:hypothetical protein
MMVVDLEFFGSDWKTEGVSFSFNLGRSSLHGRLHPFFILLSDVIRIADLDAHDRWRWGAPSSLYAASFSKPKAPTWSRWWEVSVLTTYHSGDGPQIVGDGEVAWPVLGDIEGGLRWSFGSGTAPVTVLPTGSPPPSSGLTRESLIWQIDNLSVEGYGGSVFAKITAQWLIY